MAPPAFDHNLSLLERVEDLAIEKLVSELGIEALAIAVLPWTSRLDVSRFRPTALIQVRTAVAINSGP
jgi:hypothetical protein